MPCKLPLVWPLELDVSSLCLSSEKGTPASLLVSSSAIGFPARPESSCQEGAIAVGTSCSFQHRTLCPRLPVSLAAWAHHLRIYVSNKNSWEGGQGSWRCVPAHPKGSGMAEGKGKAQARTGQTMTKASFNLGINREASIGHCHWSWARTGGPSPEACLSPRRQPQPSWC